jgi:hypothetical protein
MSYVSSYLAAALSDELRSRGIVDLGTSLCEEIIVEVIKKTAEHAEAKTMTKQKSGKQS